MKLVIAEKPSVAQSLAAVIGATARKDGYLEGGGWRVSWCVGHLAGLADADAYNPDYAKWRYDDLPILPDHWQMVVSKDKKKQFDVLKQLMNAPDVTEVVNACDAGREGELIFRAVYELAGCQKPMKRLWISSMEDSAIREGFANLRPGADYDGLRDAALCRAKADWLVGINATRLFSVLYHRTLNIGRVMSPTLALIVQREAEIDTFKPVPFYTVTLELPGFSVSGERMADKAAAQQLKTACQGAAATVKKVEHKDKSEKPPALYDLTTLQRDANRLLGYTAQQTLDYLQNLYEKKLCTYPRTDSRYLTSDMAASLPELVRLTAGALPFAGGMEISCNAAQVINDKKVTDHHAVIPTRNLQGADLSGLPLGEKAVLELVALRLLCAVAQPYTFAETAATVECAGAEFTAKGRTVKNHGWRALDAAYRAGLKNAESDKEIEDYYNANPNQFILKSDIVRCRFAKLPVEASSAGEIRTLLFADSMSSQDLFKLAGLCGNESGNYFLDGDTWLFFSDLLKEIPIQAYNRQDFLKEHRKIELESGGYVYFLNILDFKVKDMVSPLSFENQRIRNIILNLRKKELLRKIEADLMEDAKSAGLVEIY